MSVKMEIFPTSAPSFGLIGVNSALVFTNTGAAYGNAKSGVGISPMVRCRKNNTKKQYLIKID